MESRHWLCCNCTVSVIRACFYLRLISRKFQKLPTTFDGNASQFGTSIRFNCVIITAESHLAPSLPHRRQPLHALPLMKQLLCIIPCLCRIKWKNHFYEMKGDVGMSLHEKERNKKMPTPRHKVTHNPIPTSLFCFNMLFVCLFVMNALGKANSKTS